MARPPRLPGHPAWCGIARDADNTSGEIGIVVGSRLPRAKPQPHAGRRRVSVCPTCPLKSDLAVRTIRTPRYAWHTVDMRTFVRGQTHFPYAYLPRTAVQDPRYALKAVQLTTFLRRWPPG